MADHLKAMPLGTGPRWRSGCLIGLDFDLSQDHTLSLAHRGQQVPGRSGPRIVLLLTFITHGAPGGLRGALLGRGAGRLIEGISVQVLQGPAEHGLARHHTGDVERSPGALVHVRRPFGGRGKRAGAASTAYTTGLKIILSRRHALPRVRAAASTGSNSACLPALQ